MILSNLSYKPLMATRNNFFYFYQYIIGSGWEQIKKNEDHDIDFYSTQHSTIGKSRGTKFHMQTERNIPNKSFNYTSSTSVKSTLKDNNYNHMEEKVIAGKTSAMNSLRTKVFPSYHNDDNIWLAGDPIRNIGRPMLRWEKLKSNNSQQEHGYLFNSSFAHLSPSSSPSFSRFVRDIST